MSRKNKDSTEKPRLTDAMIEKIIFKAVVLFFAAILVYIPAMSGGYIYDDDSLLYNNPAIRRGEGWNAEAWKGLWSFWYPFGPNANVAADYAPLADTTLWLEWRFWGNNGDLNGPEPNPAFKGMGSPGYHTTNIILHGIAALLLWYLLAQIGIPGAWLASLLWAVHPVGAESVAWIAERRNPLSMIFFMLTMLEWFKFQKTRRLSTYWLAVFLFLLTMFSKTSIVMLPVVLLLCAWWEGGWKIQLDARQVGMFLAADAVFLLWCAGGLVLVKTASTYGIIAFALLLTPALGYAFAPLYRRLAPLWREVVDFQAALFVFLIWCGIFFYVLLAVNAPQPAMSWGVGLTGFAILVTLPVILVTKVIYDRIGSVWRQVLPFFYISIIFGLITIYFQNFRAINKEIVPGFLSNPFERIAGASWALGFYLYKALCPINLNLIYQQWHRTLPHAGVSPEDILIALNAQQAVPYSFIGIAKELIISVNFAVFFYWAWCNRATWGRHAILGMGYFVIMIAPVLGFTRMAYMRLTLVADHFQYAAMVGVIALCVAGLVQLYKRLQPALKPVLVAIGVGFVAIFCCLTWQRADAFSSPEKLWVDNVSKNPDSWQGHSHLGAIRWSQKRVDDALNEWRQSVIFAPYLYETHNNFGLALNKEGDLDPVHKKEYMQAALKQYQIAVGIDPGQFNVRTNYAGALLAAGEYERAIKEEPQAEEYFRESVDQYREVLKSYWGDPRIYNSLGVAFFNLNQFDPAIQCFEQAIKIVSKYPGPAKYPEAEDNLQKARLLQKKELESAPAPASLDTTPASAPQNPSPSGTATK